MIYKDMLKTPLAKDDILGMISKKVGSPRLNGYVKSASFCLYMTALHSGNRTVSKYVFRGHVDSSVEGAVVHYSLRPTALTIVLLCINFSLLVNGVVQHISGENNTMFLWISLLANILAILTVIWQERQCIKRFKEILGQ